MKTYLVGGAVRDALLGREVRERDYVVVGASEAEMRTRDFVRVGHAFPVFLHPETGEEHALARTESKVAPGHRGFEFDASKKVDLVTDLKRRDLTVNAMAQDEDGKIIDPYGGREDLERRVLRHVSDAFVEDPLRVLRVARFCAELRDFGFQVAEETLALMRQIAQAGELDHLPSKRVWGELARVLETRWLDVFFGVLARADCLAPWFVECQFTSAEYAKIGAWQRDMSSGAARFAVLGGLLSETDCEALVKRLAAPKAHARAATIVARHAGTLRDWRADRFDGSDRAGRADRFDHSDRSDDAESVCDALVAFARLKPATAQDEILQVVSKVTSMDFSELHERTRALGALRPSAEAGSLQGEEYGRRLRAARIALVQTWLD